MKHLVLILGLVLFCAACGSDPQVPAAAPEGGCEASVQCDGDPETIGQICSDGVCSACFSDAHCGADTYYGAGAVCTGGRCQRCTEGALGCPCFGNGTCTEGECVDGICGACPPGEEGCACLDNGGCEGGLRCEADLCGECPSGEEGCACIGGAVCIGELLCMEGVCAVDTCVAGALDCPCDGESCNDDLLCAEDGVCRMCTPDIEGCPCVEGACENDLVCDDEDDTCREAILCQDITCLPGQLCGEGEDGTDGACLEACVMGLVWDDDLGACVEPPAANCRPNAPSSIAEDCADQNRLCVEEDNDARCGACLVGFEDNGGVCELNDDANCDEGAEDSILADCLAAHRACVVQGDRAFCGDCDEGYEDQGDQCVEIIILPNCDEGAPGSIFQTCRDQNRFCDEIGDDAECGVCLDDFEERGGQCVEILVCDPDACETLDRSCIGAIDDNCGECFEDLVPEDENDPNSPCRPLFDCEFNRPDCREGEVCIPNDFGDATCSNGCDRDNNEAFWVEENTCINCGDFCSQGDGLTGLLHPRLEQGTNIGVDGCMCETEEGFFLGENLDTAIPCDADGDGWTRSAVAGQIAAAGPEVIENARCTFRSIDEVELRNELGQRKTLTVCQSGLAEGACPEELGGSGEIMLYESELTDDPDAVDVPNYGSRALTAAELNPLTKACVNAVADFNANSVPDVAEHHASDDQDIPTLLTGMVQLAYFIELHTGWFTPTDVNGRFVDGRYIIQERSRNVDMPVGYDNTHGDYWQQCTRNRDADFSTNPETMTPVGFDFALWSCGDDVEGSCPTPEPVFAQALEDEIPEHGLFEVDASLFQGRWHGMSHHSQFKCVQVLSQEEINAIPDRLKEPHKVGVNEIYNGAVGDYQLNTCGLEPLSGSEDPDGDADLDNSASPRVTCQPTSNVPDPLPVAFAAVRHVSGEGNYIRGCIDEWGPTNDPDDFNPWKSLCPGYDPNDPLSTVVVKGEGVGNDFGRLVCGCDRNSGGASCESLAQRSMSVDRPPTPARTTTAPSIPSRAGAAATGCALTSP